MEVGKCKGKSKGKGKAVPVLYKHNATT